MMKIEVSYNPIPALAGWATKSMIQIPFDVEIRNVNDEVHILGAALNWKIKKADIRTITLIF